MLQICNKTSVTESGQQTLQQSAECMLAYVRWESCLCQVHRHSTEPVHFAGQTSGSLRSVQLGAGNRAGKRPNSAAEPLSEQRGESGQQGTGRHLKHNLKKGYFKS